MYNKLELMILKPKTLVDIRKNRFIDPFSALPKRINLSFLRVRPVAGNLFGGALIIGAALSALLFLSGKVFAPIITPEILAETVTIPDEREALERELREYEAQIDDYEKTIADYSKKGASLKGEINILNTKVNKLNLQIKAVNISLGKLDGEIRDTSNKIKVVQSDIESKKTTLTKTLRNIYESDKEQYLEIMLQNRRLSDFFSNINSLTLLQSSLRDVLESLVSSHDELIDQKEQLSLKRADAATLKSYQDGQRASILSTKSEKDKLLTITKGKESEYQKYLVETRKKAAEIRSRIFQFLGGGELTFDKAYEFAKLAESATGVRAAFILAILDRESNLGKNVGRCDYKTAMHPTRDIPVFLQIIAELGLQRDLDNGIIKVSCANSDGAYGGAMGPAQFIPSTWNFFKARIAQVAGVNPPSPWRNEDAVVATSLYIKDLLKVCDGYSGLFQERCAAARYYAGSRWRNHVWGYGAKVVNSAEKFQDDIDLLNS